MPRRICCLLVVLLLGCSRPNPIPAQPADEFGLVLIFRGSTENISSAKTTIQTLKQDGGVTYVINDVSGCGYYPSDPEYDFVGDVLELSYVLRTNVDVARASPCNYTSEFHFDVDPGASKAIFNVRSDQ